MNRKYDTYLCRAPEACQFEELVDELIKRNPRAVVKPTKEPALLKFVGMHKDILMKTEFHLAAESVLLDDETVWTGYSNDGIITHLWIVKNE